MRLPGDWAPDAAYAGDAHFADVAGALDALGVERCILVGFSMGGGVAILCGGALSERVARLVVVDAYPDPIMSPGSRRIAEAIATHVGHGAVVKLDGANHALITTHPADVAALIETAARRSG